MPRALLQVAACIALLGDVGVARADALEDSLASPEPLRLLASTQDAKLVPGFRSPGMHLGGGAQRGWLIGLDFGPQWSVPQPALDPQVGLAIGAHAGFAFGNGLALLSRFDALGSPALLLPTPRQNLLTGGARYAFPGLPIEPFIEAQFGLAWYEGEGLVAPGLLGDSVTVAGGPALGALVPFGPVFALSLSARDWVSFLHGETVHAFTAELGLEFTLASGGNSR
ncbi:MAG: hypothetical protein JST54_09640 [Deltaproteobacteria bacterium]|nr:hypothetical protein [Deltaproteobacteria bacterium]